MQGSGRSRGRAGELCLAQSQEGKALFPELCFLSGENQSTLLSLPGPTAQLCKLILITQCDPKEKARSRAYSSCANSPRL